MKAAARLFYLALDHQAGSGVRNARMVRPTFCNTRPLSLFRRASRWSSGLLRSSEGLEDRFRAGGPTT